MHDEIHIDLDAQNSYGFPASRPDLRPQDIETVYVEVTLHVPEGSVPHEPK